MIRTRIQIHDMTFYLAQGRDPGELKESIVEAIRSGGGFVNFIEVGNHHVSVLVSPGVTLVIEEEIVDRDDRDTGDMSEPFEAPPGARSHQGLSFPD